MKILGGEFNGRNFYMPADIRPSQNVLRQSVFNIVGQDLSELTFLDVFAGSGAIGFEAISRGAKRVTFVERDDKCLKVIETNCELLGLTEDFKAREKYEICNIDAFVAIKNFAKSKRKFDIIFLDPPYEVGLAKKALKTLEAYDILAPNSIVVIEHNRRENLTEVCERLKLIKERKYGRSYLAVFELK